jgi:hypothetical protein
MTGALNCLDITVSAGTVTFATGTSPTLEIRGSMSLLAGTVWSSTGTITFSSTATGRTVTTNGVTFSGAVIFNGVGGGWTLGSALNLGSGSARNLSILQGTFNTADFSVTCGIFTSNGSLTRTLNLGSSTITSGAGLVGFTTPLFTSTSIALNPGTSTFLCLNSNTFAGAGLTFANFSYEATAAVAYTITGANTFNNFAVTAPSVSGVKTVAFSANQTINGTLSTTGTAGNRRVFFASATYGISVDLVVNSAPSLTDADFRGLYVRGTAAPISGTRIGNRGECRGITFSAPKTVYWNLAGVQGWAANGWCPTSGGTPNTDNFPLAQDTAVFNNASATSGVSVPSATEALPISNVDFSARTVAMPFFTNNIATCYGSWITGSGITYSGTSTLTFSGGTTQTITSAGKVFTSPITVDTYGGTVQLADALNIGTNTLGLANGTFDTGGYALNINNLGSTNSSAPRTLILRNSTVSMGGSINFAGSSNIVFNAGTSNITINGGGGPFISSPIPLTFYDFTFGPNATTPSITGSHTFNNLTLNVQVSAAIKTVSISAVLTVNGTLTCAGASAVRRIFLQSDTIGTPRTLTVNSISADDCDFRDITLAGAASGASPTRAGDCGGNTGITFPAPKTVYWNLAGSRSWSATAWCTGSGGTPDINQFPLAQDTAVFDNTGSAGTVIVDTSWNIGAFDASLRTSAMTFSAGSFTPFIYGDWKFGTGVTSSSTTGTITFAKNGTQTITSNGVQFGGPVTINHPLANVQLADALSLGSTRTLTLSTGTFDAVTYNVTTGAFIGPNSGSPTLNMGTGTWTLSGTGQIWETSNGSPIVVAGTSTIVLSNTSTTARTFSGGSFYYNKLTIGGTTGTSTLSIGGANTFGELASTKTVAHTITFVSNATNTFGKWAVTGTVGNVVTVNASTAATAFTLSIAGPANSGIDYLSVRDCTVATTSPGEFYVGANSTNVSNNTRVIFTATPAPRTLYWVGGTGNWSSTTKWDTTSGGGGGAAIPTSLDAVIFNSASNATAYTATIDAGVTLARCAAFTMAGPSIGNVTFAGSVGIAFHGNVSFAATGITRTYTGTMNWAGNSSYTFTTNGLTLLSNTTVTGIGSIWTLGSPVTFGGATITLTVTYGTFTTSASNYSVQVGAISSNNTNIRTISLNGSAVTLAITGAGTVCNFSATTNLSFNTGTSTMSSVAPTPIFNGGGQTFNNVSFTSADATAITITGANTFNTLSFAGRTSVGIRTVTFTDNQTIGTLTLNAGTASAFRTFLASNTIGTQRTLNVTTLTAGAADIDFRDIAITGAAAPLTGTRFGDAKGNSGITFDAAKTVYWAQAVSSNWGNSVSSWSLTSGGSADATAFPLAQDTAFIPFARPNNATTITVNANYNIGTLDMNERNGSALVTLATGSATPQIYGNWINGTGTTLTGTGIMTFAGRTTQQITSAGKTFTQGFAFDTPGGSVTLQDAFTASFSGATVISLISGTFNAATYNVTLSGTGAGTAFNSSGSTTRTIAVGSGTWSFSGAGTVWNCATSTNLTVTGTGTIRLTSASAKTFAGGGISYSGITLNQGGAGTLTITGNNTFKDITNTYSATGATTIALGNTTQTLTGPWTATGAAGRVLTVSGSPATLRFTGAGTAANVDYLSINNVRAYDLVDEWYAGANSTNNGSLGWYFVSAGGNVYAVTITETGTGTDAITASVTLLGTISETGTGTDTVSSSFLFVGSVSETSTITDSNFAAFQPKANITETATGSDAESAILAAIGRINETASGADTDAAQLTARATLAETATGTDTDSASLNAGSSISETATVTDAASAFATLLAAVSEAATATDLISSIKGLFAYIVESATITDALNAPGSTYNPSLTETATATDSITALARFAVQVAESASITDIAAAFRVYLSAILEAASASDAAFSQFVARSAISETATGSDADAAILAALSLISESVSGADTVTPRYIARPSVAEAATGADAASTRNITSPVIAEAAAGADSASAIATFQSQVAETSTAQDIVLGFMVAAVQVSESATGTDQISALRALAAAVVESVSGSDAVSAKAVFQGILQEIANLTDSVNAPGSTYSAPVVELATLQDAVRAAATFPTAVTEAATGTETNSAAFTPLARIIEAATVTDVASALAAFAARTAESANITDEVSPPGSIYNPVVLAAATMLDSVNAPGSIYNPRVVESAVITDSLIGGYLWNLINDAQTPDWGVINNVQASTWAATDVAQPANWQTINNAQPPNWTGVDDNQTPSWQNIKTLN